MNQLKLPLETIKCRHYQNCDAPLCPKDVDSGKRLWFPSEPICRLREAPDWVRKQRRIAKLSEIDSTKYFTLRMLNAIGSITRDIQGVNPGHTGGDKQWLAKKARKSGGTRTRCRLGPDRAGQDGPGNYPLL